MDSPTSAVERTAGFYGEGFGIRASRAALRAAQALWPGLAVRAALRLFATPLPPKWMHRRASWHAPWRVQAWAFEDASLTVYRRAGAACAPTALLVHGWGGHAGQLLPLAEALAGSDWNIALLELPGHGRSAGTTSNLPQFARALDYVVACLQAQGERVGLLAAHSLGASAAAYAASRGLPVDRLALLAPAASARKYTHYFAQVFGLSEATRSGMQRRIEEREGVLMQQFEPPAVGPRIAVPTLVVHDRGDRINGFADGQAFARAIEGAQLFATDDLGHRRILQDPLVLARVALFALS